MKYYLILNVIIFVSFVACSTSRKVSVTTEDLKQEAKDFSLSIIKSYFDEDCNKVFVSMSDSILLIDSGEILAKIDIENEICQSLRKAIRDKEKSFKDYTEFYNIEILTPIEIYKKFNRTIPEYYKPTDSDFFFIGYELKEGKDRADNFIWDDMFVFMVRKENGKWVMKGA